MCITQPFQDPADFSIYLSLSMSSNLYTFYGLHWMPQFIIPTAQQSLADLDLTMWLKLIFHNVYSITLH